MKTCTNFWFINWERESQRLKCLLLAEGRKVVIKRDFYSKISQSHLYKKYFFNSFSDKNSVSKLPHVVLYMH